MGGDGGGVGGAGADRLGEPGTAQGQHPPPPTRSAPDHSGSPAARADHRLLVEPWGDVVGWCGGAGADSLGERVVPILQGHARTDGC